MGVGWDESKEMVCPPGEWVAPGCMPVHVRLRQTAGTCRRMAPSIGLHGVARPSLLRNNVRATCCPWAPRLEASQGNILEDMELVEGLEATKATATTVQQKVVQAKVGGLLQLWCGLHECRITVCRWVGMVMMDAASC